VGFDRNDSRRSRGEGETGRGRKKAQTKKTTFLHRKVIDALIQFDQNQREEEKEKEQPKRRLYWTPSFFFRIESCMRAILCFQHHVALHIQNPSHPTYMHAPQGGGEPLLLTHSLTHLFFSSTTNSQTHARTHARFGVSMHIFTQAGRHLLSFPASVRPHRRLLNARLFSHRNPSASEQ